jgi:predicted small secreted protein
MKINTIERYVTTLGALTVLAVMMSLMFLAGCNTVKGIAKDVYSITEGVQNEMSNDNHADDIRHNDWD